MNVINLLAATHRDNTFSISSSTHYFSSFWLLCVVWLQGQRAVDEADNDLILKMWHLLTHLLVSLRALEMICKNVLFI